MIAYVTVYVDSVGIFNGQSEAFDILRRCGLTQIKASSCGSKSKGNFYRFSCHIPHEKDDMSLRIMGCEIDYHVNECAEKTRKNLVDEIALLNNRLAEIDNVCSGKVPFPSGFMFDMIEYNKTREVE